MASAVLAAADSAYSARNWDEALEAYRNGMAGYTYFES